MKSGRVLILSFSPLTMIIPEVVSISISSPVLTFLEISGHSIAARPTLKAFSIKDSSKALSNDCADAGVLQREGGVLPARTESHVSNPPTTMSPICTFFANAGSMPSMACLANSFKSVSSKYLPGSMKSVFMLSP